MKHPSNYLGKCKLCGCDVVVRNWDLEFTPNCTNDGCPASRYGYGRISIHSSKIDTAFIEKNKVEV